MEEWLDLINRTISEEELTFLRDYILVKNNRRRNAEIIYPRILTAKPPLPPEEYLCRKESSIIILRKLSKSGYEDMLILKGGLFIYTLTNFESRAAIDVDIGVGDVIVPCAERRTIHTQLPDFEAPVIMTYSLESTIAEKFDAILQRFELTGRMKDFYDIYYLSRTFDFDGARLQTAIFRTLERRGTPYGKDSFKRILTLAEDVDMQKRWKYFLKTIKDDTLEFSAVIEEIQKFLEPVFDAILNENELQQKWQSQTDKWLNP